MSITTHALLSNRFQFTIIAMEVTYKRPGPQISSHALSKKSLLCRRKKDDEAKYDVMREPPFFAPA